MNGSGIASVLLLAATFVLSSAACSESAAPSAPAGFSVQDSAGVRIVANGGDADSASLSFVEELSIGVDTGEPEYEFERIGPVVAAPDGRIFVANLGTMSVRVYDAGGAFIREFGREGEGPGEFRRIDGIRVRDDRLVVHDGLSRRATVFHLDSTAIETWDLRRPDGARIEVIGFAREDVGGAAGDAADPGVLVWVRRPSRRFNESLEPLTIFQDTTPLRVYDPAVDTMGPVLLAEPSERQISFKEVYPSDPLFEPLTVVAARPGMVYLARAGRYEIDAYDATGRHVSSVRRAVPPIPITAEHVAATKERGGRGERGHAIELAAEHPTAPAFAQIGAILPAADGSMLVLRMDDIDPVELEFRANFRGESRPTALMLSHAARWELFDAEGRYMGALRAPAGFVARYFDGQSIYGVTRDDLGVERVVRASVLRQK